MRFTSFKVYCSVCGIRFDMVNGQYWGRSERCCSMKCFEQFEVWRTKSIMGLPIDQEV